MHIRRPPINSWRVKPLSRHQNENILKVASGNCIWRQRCLSVSGWPSFSYSSWHVCPLHVASRLPFGDRSFSVLLSLWNFSNVDAWKTRSFHLGAGSTKQQQNVTLGSSWPVFLCSIIWHFAHISTKFSRVAVLRSWVRDNRGRAPLLHSSQICIHTFLQAKKTKWNKVCCLPQRYPQSSQGF